MANRGTLKKTGKLALLWVMMLTVLQGAAQDIRVEASVNRNPIMPGEQVTLTVTVANGQGEVNMPRIQGLTFLYGPSVGSSVMTVNGRRSAEYTYAWTFRADQDGVVNIPEIAVRTQAGILRTQAFDLKITSGNQGTSGAGVSGNFAVTIEPSKRKLYLGESLVLEYKIYQLFGNFRPESYDFPELQGFWPEKVDDHQGRWENQLINGQRYQVATIKVDVVFPQKTGTFTIDGFSMTGIVGSMWNRQRVSASSKPVAIEVLPLPAGKPEPFLGTFRAMDVEVKASSTHLKANEAVTLSITYSGRGNLRLLREPKITFPPDLEVYDPEVKDRIKVTPTGMTGSRTYEYLIIPRSAGNYKIQLPSASWFVPKDAAYKTKTFDDVLLEVERGEGGSEMSYSFSSKSDVQLLNKDIRFIRTSPGILVRLTRTFYGSIGFFILYALPLALFLGAIFIRRRREEEFANVKGVRRKNAGKVARKWLKEASSVLRDQSRFFDALSRALEHYVMDKFGLDRSGVNTASIRSTLEAAVGAELTNDFIDLYERCGMARYAPDAAGQPDAMLNEASELIKRMEDAL